MIIKMDRVTTEQVLKLKELMDSRDNLFILGPDSIFRKGTEMDAAAIAAMRASKSHYNWYHPIKLIKCESACGEDKDRVQISFNLVLEVSTRTGIEATPRDVINKLWEALEIFPETK